MPVHHLGEIIGESDPKIWRVIEAYVEEARELEDFSEVTVI
jgi:hypothetical protein